jgi:hypothetical protein
MVIGRLERHVLPLRVGYKTILEPRLRCMMVVYGGILTPPDEDASTIVVRECMRFLRRREADVIFFNGLRTDSSLYMAIRGLPPFWQRSHLPTVEQHWETLLPSQSEGLGGLLSKKHQRDLNRCIRNLEKTSGPIRIDCYLQKNDIAAFVEKASRISASAYQAGLGCRSVDDPLTWSVLNQSQKDGWLRAYILHAGSEPIAFEYGCVVGRTYFAESAAYDARWRDYGPGTILQVKIFEQLTRNDAVVKYDYGFGDATYKQRFGSASWPEASAYIFAPALYPVVMNLTDCLVRGLSIATESLIETLGLTARIKRWWRRSLLASHLENRAETLTRRRNEHEDSTQ